MIGIGISPMFLDLAGLNYYQQDVLQKFADSIVAYWAMQGSTLTELDLKNGLTATYGPNSLFKQPGANPGRKSIITKKGESIKLKSTAFSSRFNFSEGTISFWINPINIKNLAGLSILAYFYIDDNNRIAIEKGAYNAEYVGIYAYYRGNNIAVSPAPYSWFYKNSFLNITLTYSISGGYLRMYLDGTKVMEGIISIPIIGTNMWITEMFAPEDLSYSDLVVLNRPATDSEVLTLANCKINVVFEGDSRTTEEKQVWSSAFDLLDKKYKYKVNSVSGSTVASLTARGAAVDAMVIAGMPNILSLLIGVNNSSDNATTIFNGVKSYCLARRAAGYRINLCTEIDSTVAGWTAKSIALNNLYKADNSFYDTLSDLRADVRLQDATNITYYVDGTHLTLLGQKIMGGIIAPNFASGL